MDLLRCTSALVLLTIGFTGVANAQTEKTFPTDDEINLVLTQTDVKGGVKAGHWGGVKVGQ
jgi:hypothetical protein